MSYKLTITILTSFIFLCAFTPTGTEAQRNYAVISIDNTFDDIIRKAANITPSPQQYEWQRMEFIAFTHFTINTFTDKEWGDGTEDPSLFNPREFDARQWVRVLKDAGMKLVIVTCKHHDGFCLWPSKYTEHSVKNSPWRNGKGDIVKEVSDACREAGLKFGVYLSPWDRHEPTYGDSPVYNEFFKNQLRELLTNYGDIAEVWFDGACGEGPNGKRQVYDWPAYYKVIRELQPDAVIAIMGPDVRWVGTETGYGRQTEWSVVPVEMSEKERIASDSQKIDTPEAFRPKELMDKDLGSREKIRNAGRLIWYPSEVDVSIRPGWFYHASQDEKVKTPEKLVDIYFSSVGRNSLLLLNIPPDTRGLIHENDIRSLMGMRKILDGIFKINLAEGATVTVSNMRNKGSTVAVVDGRFETYWTTEEGIESASLELKLTENITFDVVMLQENILVGQRVEKFIIEVWNNGVWRKVAEGTTIGYKRLLRFPEVTTDRVRLTILESRTNPAISEFGLFNSPLP